MSAPRHPAPPPDRNAPGLAARWLAAGILDAVLRRKQPLDDELEARAPSLAALEERDRALVRRLVGTVLRRLGTLRHLLTLTLDRGLPADAVSVEPALLLGAAQILFLDVPDHAAVDLAVRLVQADRHAARYAGLVNAVLRRIGREGKSLLAGADHVALDTPDWLMRRWVKTFGASIAHDIAAAHAQEPPLDLTVKDDPQIWAERLGGRALATGTVRVLAQGPVPALEGFAEGEWWVQDAAAALPAQLFGDVRGRRVADFCAAPGGKTAQLALAGAHVTAIDRSAPRLARLSENLARLKLEVEIVRADAAEWKSGPFDAILVDAPCLATGTIRRHPDLPWLKQESNLASLMALQIRILDNAAAMLAPGGMLVFCTCSLEPEEGADAIAAFLARKPEFRRRPVTAADVFGQGQWLTADGDLRTLPCHLPDPDPQWAGMDGFFASRLERR